MAETMKAGAVLEARMRVRVELTKQMYSPVEVAKMVSVSRDTVLRMIQRGELRARNMGTEKRATWRVPKDAIIDLVCVK
jgi:excisionase family DNA binding protein